MDASALAKTIFKEPESAALKRFLRQHPIRASSALAQTELLGAVRRVEPSAVPLALEVLRRLLLLEVTDAILMAAGMLEPVSVRTLDAIHLASAQALAPELEALVTYDQRMAEAAQRLALPLVAPA
ncbi:MAG: type II toxin-antitoxin system VapC family toxin [Acidimicrobiia bacterium]